MTLPEARREGLTVRELVDETLVYDLERNQAHCLNRAAALVWRHCNGHTSIPRLAAILCENLGVPADDTLVLLALEQLGRRNLLRQAPRQQDEVERRWRRDALKKMLGVLAAFPAIMTVTGRAAGAQASSKCAGACQLVNGQDPCTINFGAPCFCSNQLGGMGNCIKG
jgi:hypothetical protein